ncbi:nucleotidyltransferase domain-containing protein [Thermincola potens]|uniref:DNA polymerase beta domain protein region n=1 Tax=Thermincola potens (strain JR) TaxID=635013 RepID=D5XD28_THEPJ|nr:nucleotidyltransferase domain-containing protein [Thermincola potens]ADG83704.1 DNA polymerase beta domain protein region [Thermincola potens JR]
MVKRNVEVTINRYLAVLKARNIPIDKAILFGSYATGVADNDSDIDLALVSRNFGKDYFNEGVRLKLLTVDIDPDISPRPYSLDDYRKAKSGEFLFDEIIIKGKVVYDSGV